MPHGIRISTTTLSSRDPAGLSAFWADLLGEERPRPADPTWVVLRTATTTLAFDLDEAHRPPVWPSRDDAPSLQTHVEVQVDDLAGALDHALRCGARLADHQPQDDVRVCLDPAGHPFCLWVDPSGEDPAGV